MRFLFIEPFYGGSHKTVTDGLIRHCAHKVDLAVLPARFWKWRMRGAGLYFARHLPDLSAYDGIVTTNMMPLSDFLALRKDPVPPVLVYFHENQLTYPVGPGETRDLHFGFTDITTALCADAVRFNSAHHMEAFLAAARELCARMPDVRPRWAVAEIRKKSAVLYPGCGFGNPRLQTPALSPPIVLWNHRWEFDKNPEPFFHALFLLADKGVDFQVALLGQRFSKAPPVFEKARHRLGPRLVQYGFVRDRNQYANWLKKSLVAASCAIQENFGVAMVEAMAHGCIPLLPRRLSYPEILPRPFHRNCLYNTSQGLETRLAQLLLNPGKYLDLRPALSGAATRFSWENRIQDWNNTLARLAETGKTGPVRPPY